MDIITVIVLTYNSKNTIIETLESIYKQSYESIELIISDDCSNDNTVKLVENWSSEFKDRFEKVHINVNKLNQGISKNINTALRISTGRYIKLIAGDDLLDLLCLEKNLTFSRITGYKIVFSRARTFSNNCTTINSLIPLSKDLNKMSGKTSKEQFMLLLENNILVAPTVFFERGFIINMGGFIEEFRNCEDYPTWLDLTYKGIELGILNEVTVDYRINPDGITGNRKNAKNLYFYNMKIDLIRKYLNRNEFHYFFINYINYLMLLEKITILLFNSRKVDWFIRKLKWIHPYNLIRMKRSFK